MQLRVIKTDGTTEEYMYTKVLGTFNHAMDDVHRTNIFAAEQFAEAVTYHLYHNNDSPTVKSSSIADLAVNVLEQTDYAGAANALKDHRMRRKVQRTRIEVLSDEQNNRISRWNKSLIVKNLTQKYGLSQNIARAIASSVEEKILKLEMTHVHKNLIEQIVIAETNIMVCAEKELEFCNV